MNNIFEGAGQLGDGALTLDNQAAGIIDATETDALYVDTGLGSFANEGLIEATGSGGLLIEASAGVNTGTIEAKTNSTLEIGTSTIVNNGMIEADGGTIDDYGAQIGAGSVTIGGGGLANFTGVLAEDVKFIGSGTLELGGSAAYSERSAASDTATRSIFRTWHTRGPPPSLPSRSEIRRTNIWSWSERAARPPPCASRRRHP